MEMWSGMEGDGHGRCAPVPFWCPPILVSLFCLGRRTKSITTISTTCRGHPRGRASHFAASQDRTTTVRTKLAPPSGPQEDPFSALPQHQNALRDTCFTAKIDIGAILTHK